MTTRRPTPVAIALATVVLLTLLLPTVALGHAELDTVTPADKSTVAGPPAEIVMTFTQHLDPAKSNIKLVNAGGTVVAEDSSVDADRLTVRLPVPADLSAGTYTARWTSFSSDDNEQDRGTTTFTVTAATPPPSVAPSSAPSAAPSVAPSAAPSLLPSVVPSVAPSPSSPPSAPAASTSDALIPVIVVVIAIVALGMWLLRRRSRRGA